MLWRNQPPPNEIVEQHSRRQPTLMTKDGERLLITIPTVDRSGTDN